MRVAVIGGSGVYSLPGEWSELEIIDTRYGKTEVFLGKGENQDLVFLPRHKHDHSVPPHRINYRANIKALRQLGVERIIATFAVGSINPDIPPRSLVALDQFLDFTSGRENTFFDGSASGLAHTDLTQPYCPALRARLLELAQQRGINIRPSGTYVCTNGPRFETPAEIHMFAKLDGDVVGMTGVPEAVLARELRIHYAAVALSINWGVGLQSSLEIVNDADLKEIKTPLIDLFIDVLRTKKLAACSCMRDVMVIHPPVSNN
jgi:5'-methylthioadenosine phosphorylase